MANSVEIPLPVRFIQFVLLCPTGVYKNYIMLIKRKPRGGASQRAKIHSRLDVLRESTRLNVEYFKRHSSLAWQAWR